MIENWKQALSQIPIIGDLGPYAALCLALWVVAFLVRKFAPNLWLPLTRWPNPEHPVSHLVQALPTAVVGAIFAGATTGEVEEIAWGALAGFAAPLWHHVLKATPAPYRGELNDRATKVAKAVKRLGSVSIVLLTVGCASRQPVNMQELVERANMPPERAACLIATEAAYRARDAACKKDRSGDCSTDVLIDKQHEEIDLCFSNF